MKRAFKLFFDFAYLNVMRFMKDPERFQDYLLAKWGDPFPLNFPRLPYVWLTSNPETVKKIFTAPLGTFIPSEHNPVSPLLGRKGLIMLGGIEHSESRKNLGPNFMGQQLRGMGQSIVDTFYEITKEHNMHDGAIVLQEFSQAVTLRIILRQLFPHIEIKEMWEMEKLTKNFLSSYSPSLLFIPKWFSKRWKIFNENKKKLDSLFYKCYLSGLYSNVEGPIKTLSEKHPTKEQVLDQLRTMVVAGHETTATSLVWTLYLIHQTKHQDSKQELLKDVDSVEKEEILNKFNELTYLDAVVNEALRIRPPVPFITRKVVGDFSIGNQHFKKEEELGVSISLLHRCPQVWSRPDVFLPERFLNRKYAAHEFAPFGGSNRKCIGAALAISELKILTTLFLKEFDSALCSEELIKPKVMQITIGPREDIVMVIRKRLNNEAQRGDVEENFASINSGMWDFSSSRMDIPVGTSPAINMQL